MPNILLNLSALKLMSQQVFQSFLSLLNWPIYLPLSKMNLETTKITTDLFAFCHQFQKL